MTESTENQTEGSIDPAEYRRVLGHMPTGVTVVTAAASTGPVGVAIGSFVSISLAPPLVGFFLGNQSGSGLGLRDAGSFCVNILGPAQLDLCADMASRADDKFARWEWSPSSATGSPLFPDISAFVDCEIDDIVSIGDHDLFVGRVLDLDTVAGGEPMVFHTGRYGSFGTVD